MWLWLAGCAQLASQSIATPPDTPTQIKATASTVNPDEKQTTTPATSAGPLLTATPAQNNQTFTDPMRLRWEALEQNGCVVRQLAGFTLPLRLVGVSPRGDWLAASGVNIGCISPQNIGLKSPLNNA